MALRFEASKKKKSKKSFVDSTRNVESDHEYNYQMLWSDKYEPQSTKELVLHHSKIKAARDWLLKSCYQSTVDDQTRILILCGCSGCGKSTLIKTLCSELSISLIDWSEDVEQSKAAIATTTSYRPPSSSSSRNSLPIDQYIEREQKVQDDDVEEFAVRSSYPSLLFTTTSSSSASSSSSWNKHNERIKEASRRIIVIHDPASMNNNNSISNNFSSSSFSPNKSLSGIVNQLTSFRDPVVLIISDVVGKDDCYHEIEQIIPKQYHHWFQIETIFCPPITEKNVYKVLTKIVADESRQLRKELLRIDKSFRNKKDRGTLSLPDEEIQEISTTCLGDLRHAISAIQIRMLSNFQNNQSLVTVKNNFKIKPPTIARDKSFSMLHGIGKLLYSTIDHANDHLSFDPEIVLQSSDLPLDISLSFLQWNSYEIFGKSRDDQNSLFRLEASSQLFSDCQILLDRQYTTDEFLDRSGSQGQTSLSMFPGEYVVAISSRIAVATSLHGLKFDQPDETHVVDSDFEDFPKPKQRKLESQSSKSLVFVRRPRNLDLRSKALSLRNKLLNLRGYSTAGSGNLKTTFELTTTILPYYRYFYSNPQQIQFSNEIQTCLQSICQNTFFHKEFVDEGGEGEEEDVEQGGEGEDDERRNGVAHCSNIEVSFPSNRRNNRDSVKSVAISSTSSSPSPGESQIEEINSFSDDD